MLSRAWANAVELFDFNAEGKCDFPRGSLEERKGPSSIARNVMDMHWSNAIIVRAQVGHKNVDDRQLSDEHRETISPPKKPVRFQEERKHIRFRMGRPDECPEPSTFRRGDSLAGTLFEF